MAALHLVDGTGRLYAGRFRVSPWRAEAERALQVIGERNGADRQPGRWIRGIEASDAQGMSCAPATGEPSASVCTPHSRTPPARRRPAKSGCARRACGRPRRHRRLWATGKSVRYGRTNPYPGTLIVAWNDEAKACDHQNLLEALADADTAIRVRGRALWPDDGRQARLRSTETGAEEPRSGLTAAGDRARGRRLRAQRGPSATQSHLFRESPVSSDGSVHAVRCCRVSGLVDCGTSYAAGLYGDTRVESKIVCVCSKALGRLLVFPTPSR